MQGHELGQRFRRFADDLHQRAPGGNHACNKLLAQVVHNPRLRLEFLRCAVGLHSLGYRGLGRLCIENGFYTFGCFGVQCQPERALLIGLCARVRFVRIHVELERLHLRLAVDS